MLISVVIPFHNEYSLIRRCVQSVYKQDMSKTFLVQVVIGNDSSFPIENLLINLPPIIDSRFTVEIVNNEKEHCAGFARNAAIDLCRGDVISFLDADDLWMPNKLQNQLDKIFKGYTFICTSYRFLSSRDIISAPQSSIRSSLDILYNSTIGTSTVMLTRQLLQDSRFSNRGFSQDTELWAELANHFQFRYCGIQDCLVEYSPSGRTSNKVIQLVNYCGLLNYLSIPVADKCKIIVTYTFRGINNHYCKNFYTNYGKRMFDLFAAIALLSVTFPLIFFCFLIACIEFRGNGIFIQERTGLNGKEFNMYKIKTMHNPTSKNRSSHAFNNVSNISVFGRYFRILKIDELPQLVNVILGSMSFVGPRPDVKEYSERIKDDDYAILQIRPGITSPASTKYRNEEELLAVHADPIKFYDEIIFPDKVKMNRSYANNISFLGDLRIILGTVFHN